MTLAKAARLRCGRLASVLTVSTLVLGGALLAAPAAWAVDATTPIVATAAPTATPTAESTPPAEPTAEPTPAAEPTAEPTPTAENCDSPLQPRGEVTAASPVGSSTIEVHLPAYEASSCFTDISISIGIYAGSSNGESATIEVPASGYAGGDVVLDVPATSIDWNVSVRYYATDRDGEAGLYFGYDTAVYAAESVLDSCIHESDGPLAGPLDASASGGVGEIEVTVSSLVVADCVDSASVVVTAVPLVDDLDDSGDVELLRFDAGHTPSGGSSVTAVPGDSYWIVAFVTAVVDGEEGTYSYDVVDDRVSVTQPTPSAVASDTPAAVTTTPAATVKSTAGKTLASTGAEPLLPITLGSALLVLGLVALVAARLRRVS